MSSKLLYFCLLVILFHVNNINASYSLCGDWQTYMDEKCIKILDTEKLATFDDALKSCSQIDNNSQLLTIHSKEENDFISEYLFKTSKLVDNVWIGLRNKTKSFEWVDSSNKPYTNWRTGNPTNKTDFNCVELDPDSLQWTDQHCNKKGLVVCQKLPQISDVLKQNLELKEKLKKTEDELKRCQIQSNDSSHFLQNKDVKHYHLFTDLNGKNKAFFIPSRGLYRNNTFEDGVNLCKSFNSTLIDIESLEKQKKLESFLNELGQEFLSSKFPWFWINGLRDSSGKWKWIDNNKEFVFTNWGEDQPVTYHNFNNLEVYSYYKNAFGKWYNDPKEYTPCVMCEHSLEF